MNRLEGKVCLVTGSARGIGAGIARTFVREGARVAVTYRTSEAEAQELAEELDALCLPLDVTDRASVRAAMETVVERWERLDVLVNNAGWLRQQPFLEITEDDWDKTLDTNLKGTFLCTQEAARVFERQGSGAVINIASVGGQFGGPKAPHYSASKAAVLAFTKSTARVLSPMGVRVNAISPGFVRTEMIAHLLEDEAAVAADVPVGRIGEPEDVAAAAVYLASHEAGFVTGATLNVNGGQWMG